jgi:hypothetical protein
MVKEIERSNKVLVVEGLLKTRPQQPVEIAQVNLDTQATGYAKLQDILQKNTGLPSECPWYSKEQLRRINRIRARKSKYGHGNISWSRYLGEGGEKYQGEGQV